jgi:sugar phosphate isomerase/epimerase
MLCYDVANGFMVEDVTDGLTASQPWLGLVHLSDTTRARWMHDPLGHGYVPLRQVLTTLQGIGYTGRIVLETLHDKTAADGFAADRRVLREAGWAAFLSAPGRP